MVNRNIQFEEAVAASHSTKLSIQTPRAKTSDQLADEFLQGGALNLSTAFLGRNPSIPNAAVLKESSSLFECQPLGSPEKLVDETLVTQAIIGGHINDLITMSASLPAPLDLTLVLIGIGFGFFAWFQRAGTDTQPNRFCSSSFGVVLLGVIAQALSWLKLLPRVFWSSYQRAQEKYPDQSSKLDRNLNKRK
jgi:hypothetical protein